MAVSHTPIVGEGRRMFSCQSQMLVVRGRGWGFQGRARCWLCGRRFGGSHGNPRRWMWGASVVLMADPDAGLGGRWGFSWQYQTLVVSGRGGGSHGSPRRFLCGLEGGSHGSLRRWLWLERPGFSWQSQMLVVEGGDVLVLMAVSDAGCGYERPGFSWQYQMLVGGEVGALMAVQDAGCGGRGGDSHGSHNRWFVVVETGVLMAVSENDCVGQRRGFSWQSQTLVVGW